MPKSVLIDLDKLKDLTTGLGQVALFFGTEISKIQDNDLKFTFLVPNNFVGYFGNNVNYETISLKHRYLPFLNKKYDLWYTIHQDSPFFPNRLTPFVLTINDLNFLGEKCITKAKRRLKRLQKKVDKSTLITVISKYTETQVRANLNIPNHIPINVIYCGVDVQTFENVKKPDFAPEGDLLFSIGVIQAKKNIQVLIPFMEKLPENYKLVITGNKTSEYANLIEKEIAAKNLGHRVFLPGKISDEDKFWMYNNCKAVLFPSKFEGMGFPPVEAMRFGKPVFASTHSSIPEVSEDKAYYWDNFDPEYMSAVFIEKIKEFNNDSNRPTLLKEHSIKFNWSENAKTYVKLFKEILEVK